MNVLHKRILDGNADAVEFCSTPAYHNLLAAASYTLIEGPSPTRVGGIYLFILGGSGDDDENDDVRECSLHELQTIETSGVLDIKWRRPGADQVPPSLAQASADGSVRLYTLQDDDNKPSLLETSSLDLSSSMCLSLDWSPSDAHLATSHSNGTITTLDVTQASSSSPHSSPCVLSSTTEAHSLEVWVVSYDSWHPTVLYSGADDCHFCAWDVRCDPSTPIFRNKKGHAMGVTSVQANPHVEHVVVTGSYDEMLRVWDMRMTSRVPVAEGRVTGGGVWRVKWHPRERDVVVAACMHRGFVVARLDKEGLVEVVEDYEEHESLGYGVDWYHGRWRKQGSVVASCSFYDKALHVWETNVAGGADAVRTV